MFPGTGISASRMNGPYIGGYGPAACDNASTSVGELSGDVNRWALHTYMHHDVKNKVKPQEEEKQSGAAKYGGLSEMRWMLRKSQAGNQPASQPARPSQARPGQARPDQAKPVLSHAVSPE